MITQYDCLAEIEAAKWKPSRRRAAAPAADTSAPQAGWTDASERAIREEMERRLARHALRRAE